jgi:aminopeptidase N
LTRTLLSNTAAAQAGLAMAVGPALVEAVRRTLADAAADRSLRAYALTLPALAAVAEDMPEVDPDALAAAARFTRRALALSLRPELEATCAACALPAAPFRADREAVGLRRLRNVCLGYLAAAEDAAAAELCLRQAREPAACMTDVMAATEALASCEAPVAAAAREEALALFYERHAKGNDLLFCKWLTLQVPERGVRVRACVCVRGEGEGRGRRRQGARGRDERRVCARTAAALLESVVRIAL